jgi:glycosyltransferase involved in cell wall biosynthesis
MRVVHVNANAASAGGTETYLAALLQAQVARGDDVSLVHRSPAAGFPAGVTYAVADNDEDAWGSIRRHRPDVVHVHDWSLSPQLEERLRATYPVVTSLHSFAFACASGEHYFRDGAVCTRAHGVGCLAALALKGCAHGRNPLRPVRQFREIGRRLPSLRESRAVVVASSFVRSVALTNGFSPERCYVIPYFVHRPAEPPLPGRSRDVVFVGRIARNKGLDVLMRALALVPTKWRRLVVAGDGWHRDQCVGLSVELGLRDRVDFLGWRSRDEVGGILENVRALALPSRWPEPFGIAGLEANARARPVVASRIGGIPEWLEDGLTGLLVAPGDSASLAEALASVLDDEDRAAAIGREGWLRAARFSVERHLDSLDGVYLRAAA